MLHCMISKVDTNLDDVKDQGVKMGIGGRIQWR